MSRASAIRRLVSALVAVVLMTAALGATPASAAPPGAPTGLSTSDTGPRPTFAWTRVAKATSYVVEAYRDSFGGTRVFSVGTVNASYVHTKRIPTGEVVWRVRALNREGTSTWSEDQLTVGTADVLQPTSPIDGAQVTPPVDPPVLAWKVVPGAVGYQVQVATNDTFTSPQAWSTKSTSFVVPNPQVVGTYYWRFRADFGGGMLTDWSYPEYYEVAQLPLIEGDDAMSPPTDRPVQDVVLQWAPVRGAQRYQLQVATDRSFNTVIDDKSVYSTRYSPPRTYPNNDYFWRVRAVNAAGQPTGWAEAPIEFQRRWSDRATPIAPADVVNPAAGDPFFYEWTPVAHAQRYKLEVGSDPNFSPGTFDSCYTTSTTYTAGYLRSDRCMPNGQGSVNYWRVLAVEPSTGAELPSLYSPIRSFIYDSGPVVKTAPAPGATVDVPTLRWEASREADSYRVQLRDNTNRVVTTVTTHALSWTPREALDPAKSPYSWTVVALDEDASQSPNYGWRYFSVTGVQPDDPDAAPLKLTRPEPSTRFPALTWEPFPRATHYRITVGVDGTGYNLDPSVTPVLRTDYAYSSLTDEGEYFLTPGTYRWQITAYEGTAVVGRSGTSTFTIEELPAVTGQRIALTGTATGSAGHSCATRLDAGVDPTNGICLGVPSTPVLRWDPVPGASSYMVYLAEDRDLTQLVYGDSATNSGIPTTKNTMWTPSAGHNPSALPDNESGEAYFWYIRPCKTRYSCGSDPLNTDDAATNAFRKISPQVEQLAPVEGATVGHQVTFTWKDYLETNEVVTFPRTAGAPASHLTADGYRIQVFTSRAGGAPIDDTVVDQTTYTPWRATYPEGDLWWRVQAIDGAGNGLAWSPMRQFRHETPYANLNPTESLSTGTQGPFDSAARPAADQRVAGDSPLSWTARDYDASWNIEIYRNDDTTGSPANLVVRASTQQAAYTWANQLPASGSAYRWRIQRKDAQNRVGPWSDWGRFFVDNTEVTLLQPGEGYLPADGAVFAWDAVAGASGPVRAATYQLTVTSDDGGTPFTVTTVATRWAETRRLRTGTYSWSVRAIDATGGVIGTSPRRTFRIDDQVPTVVRATPTGSPKPGANVKVVFSEPVTNVTASSIQLYVKGKNTPLRTRVTLSSDGRTATLNPSANMARRKLHTVRVRPTVRDLAGNTLAAYSWTFTVR